jgi:hypothetical protein
VRAVDPDEEDVLTHPLRDDGILIGRLGARGERRLFTG